MRDLNTRSYTAEEIFKEIRDKILVFCFDLDKINVTLETNLIDDLGADNLDIVEVILSIEDEFDIYVPQSEENNTTDCTLKHYVDVVATALGDRFIKKEADNGRTDQGGDDHQENGSPETH